MAQAEVPLTEQGELAVYGDARLRLEADFDGRSARGEAVEDRARARVRARTGLIFRPGDLLTLDARIRTGADQSHQSPHITILNFSGNKTENLDANFDKWYAQAKREGAWAWIGRNDFPFWSQDEIFWDSDATLAGVAGGWSHQFDDTATVSSSAGYFALPVGMQDFSGYMRAAEVIYAQDIRDTRVSLGGSVFDFLPDRDDPDAAMLLTGNGYREYRIWIANVRLGWEMKGIPWIAEVDWLHNSQNYSPQDTDVFTAAHHDQTDGYVLSLQMGDVDKAGRWLAAYYYAYIETLAANASYAQDDWVRWGAEGQTRASDMQGHQFNLGYALTDRLNMIGRLYLVEAITTGEESNRFRLDLNYEF